MKKHNFPDWLAVVGQSGAGKGTVAKILLELYKQAGLEVMHIDTGTVIREAISKDTYFARKMHSLNIQGKRQPNFVAASLWFNKMFNELKENSLVLHEGSPRYEEQFMIMKSLVDTGYFNSLKVLEVITSPEICADRLFMRTKRDKRSDLSVDGKPGIPDLEKIKTKMDWWTADRDGIITAVKASQMYLSVYNNEDTTDQLRAELEEIFLA